MAIDPLDNQISELSHRLERLRVLYEQYFMGFERTEPTIAKKDVERRVYELRKLRFPTTAKRFKFQTIIQRYNSLQQYWVRTCREIENGTYRKHRIKAKKRFTSESVRPAADDAKERAEAAVDAKEEATNDLAQLMDGDVDLNAELGNALAALEARPPSGKKSKGKSPSVSLLSSLAPKNRPSAKLKLPEIALKEKKGASSLGSGPLASLRPLEMKNSRAPAPAKKSAVAAPLRAKSPRAQAAAGAAKKEPAKKAKLPVAPGKSPAAKTPVKKAVGGLSEDRIRALHASYSDAREKTKSRAVSLEKLSRSIRETEQKLRARNKGRGVDFEVSIQGGKAILKPKLK